MLISKDNTENTEDHMDKNKQQLVYDLPTRIFHWAFALLFICSFLIAKITDDDHLIFSYHMISGLLLGFLVLLRVFWGIFGTQYARFSSFVLHPSKLISYFKNIFSHNQKLWTGHNPASSWAALIMMGSAFLLAVSGILMTTGAKESFEDIHEIFANIFLLTVIVHIIGVFFHSFRHQDGITLTMIHGKKQINAALKISNSQTIPAFIFVILITLFSSYLISQYNPSTQQLNLFGKTLFFSENKKDDKNYEKKVDWRSIQEESYNSYDE